LRANFGKWNHTFFSHAELATMAARSLKQVVRFIFSTLSSGEQTQTQHLLFLHPDHIAQKSIVEVDSCRVSQREIKSEQEKSIEIEKWGIDLRWICT